MSTINKGRLDKVHIPTVSSVVAPCSPLPPNRMRSDVARCWDRPVIRDAAIDHSEASSHHVHIPYASHFDSVVLEWAGSGRREDMDRKVID